MKKKDKGVGENSGLPLKADQQAQELRRQAEQVIRQQDALPPVDMESLTLEKSQKLLQELQVHQVELAMQNEELRASQMELEKNRSRYLELYDLAPVGYLTVSEQGFITLANLTFATLLGVERNALINKPLSRYILKEDQDVYYIHRKKLFESGEDQQCELRMVKADGTAFWAKLRGNFVPAEDDGVPFCRLTLSDITESNKSEEALRESEQRAKRQRAAITDLFFEDTITAGEIVPAVKKITEVISNSVKVERVSIWVIDEKSEQLQCLDLYESSTGKHSSGDILHIKTFPSYFEAILKDSRISVANAQEDPRSRELNEGYFKLLGITSLLDAGIVVDGNLKGVVSFEHVGGQRRVWHADEEAFASTIASMVGQLFISVERNKAEAEIHTLNAELEQRVNERTTELETVNKELASFAYSVSHDFRAPLRALNAFSASLTEKYNDQLDEQGLHYLTRIRKAALYMSDLIDDLLKLSNITRTEVKEQEADISHLSEEILKELQEADPERRVQVEVTPGLSTKGDIALLKAALENLIGNAWKFSSLEPQAEIKVGQTVIDGEKVFFVRDNGVGFNMAYSGKLFSAFQRLHGVDEFPGTGIGLATAQRIINRHSGRIWAESEVGKGATFYFTLQG